MSTSEIVNAEKVEEKPCSNCKKPIEVPKLRLHESTCRRNTVKCGKCQEVIPKCVQEQHEFEFHDIISCEYCQDFDCERFMMKEHHDYCIMKPQMCKYCELMITQVDDQFEKHIVYCGSKTRDCEICGTVLKQRELRAHMESGVCEIVLEEKQEAQRNKVSSELERFRQQDQARIAQQASTGKVLQSAGAHPSSQTSQSSNKVGQKRQASKPIAVEEDDEDPMDNDTPTRKIMDENKVKINKMLNIPSAAQQKKEIDNKKREAKQKEKKVQKKFFM